MPLRRGYSRSIISNNIREFHTGETYAKTASKFGKKDADRQAVAVALDTARRSKRRGYADGGAPEDWRDREAKLGLALQRADVERQKASERTWADTARDVAGFPGRMYQSLSQPSVTAPSEPVQPGDRLAQARTVMSQPGPQNVVPNLAHGLTEAVTSGFTAPHDAYTGQMPMTDAEGHTSPEAIRRGFDLASIAGGASAAGTAERAAAGAGTDFRLAGRQVLASDSQAVGAPVAALEHAPKFYSGLERAVEEAPLTRASGSQWLGTIGKGVKKEELEHTGTLDFLTQNADRPLTKQEVLEHVGANKVQLGEVQKTGAKLWDELTPAQRDRVSDDFHDHYPDIHTPNRPDWDAVQNFYDRASLEGNYNLGGGEGGTKFSSYQLPGGTGYREKLLTLPPTKVKHDSWSVVRPDGHIESTWASPEAATKWAEKIGGTIKQNETVNLNGGYRSSHWDEPNVLVHRRTNEREVQHPLSPEETQAVEIRKAAQADLDKIRVAQNDVARKIQARATPFENDRKRQIMADLTAGKITRREAMARVDEYVPNPNLKPLQDRLQTLRAQEDQLRASLPPEPKNSKPSLHMEEIQSDWHQQGRQKGYADTGRDWTAEKTQFAPGINGYRVSDGRGNHIADVNAGSPADAIAAAKQTHSKGAAVPDVPFKKNWHELALKDAIREAAEKGIDRISWTPGEAQAARYDLSKHMDTLLADPQKDGTYLLVGRKNNANTFEQRNVPAEKIADYVGKDVAQKLLEAGKNKYGMHELNGQDLRVGGEGMKGFYDKIIPDAMNKIGKPHGVKVEGGSTGTSEGKVVPRAIGGFRIEGDNAALGIFDTRKEAEAALKASQQPVHYMDIPQSLKDQALKKGFSMFEDSTPGAAISAAAHSRVPEVSWPSIDKVERSLSPEAQRALDGWVGGTVDTMEQLKAGHHPGFGLFHRSSAQKAINSPQAAEELQRAFQPLRDQLRAEHGDTVTLYRHHGEIPSGATPHEMLSFTSDRDVAESISGAGRHFKPMPESEIAAKEAEFERTGRVSVGKHTWLERTTETFDPAAWGQPGQPKEITYTAIMRPDGMVTDTESVRAYLNDINKERVASNSERETKLGNVKQYQIPIDDIIAATDRFGQKEFLVRNTKGLFEDSASTGAPIAAAEHVTQTPQFKQWFEGSKALDAEGKPERFYHGTTSDFETFGPIGGGNQYGQGYYFTKSPESASNYATGDVNRISPDGNAHPNVMPVYLKYEKPYDRRGPVSPADLRKLETAANEFEPGHWKRGELARQFERAYPANGDNVAYVLGPQADKIIRNAGFDAFVDPHMTVVFDPTQIKSAIGNSGAFSPKNPSIVRSSGATGAPLAASDHRDRDAAALAGATALQKNKPAKRKAAIVPERKTGGPVNSAAMEVARTIKRAKGGGVHIGPIVGHTDGRADKVPMEVPNGSYVLTSDHCSAMGEGNTLAGFKKLKKMFPKSVVAYKEAVARGPSKRASGGRVPILAADGEFVICPEDIKDRWGDLDKGHHVLDHWQTSERKNHIKTLAALAPPAQD